MIVVEHLHLTASAQLSSILVWADDLADGHLDANGRASVASAATDP